MANQDNSVQDFTTIAFMASKGTGRSADSRNGGRSGFCDVGVEGSTIEVKDVVLGLSSKINLQDHVVRSVIELGIPLWIVIIE